MYQREIPYRFVCRTCKIPFAELHAPGQVLREGFSLCKQHHDGVRGLIEFFSFSAAKGHELVNGSIIPGCFVDL